MTSRQRIRTIISGKAADRCGFWLGCPEARTWPILHKYFGTRNEEELRRKLNDDFRWIAAWDYHDPSGQGMFHIPNKISHGDAGPLAHCERVEQLDEYDWPKLQYMAYESTVTELKNVSASSGW